MSRDRLLSTITHRSWDPLDRTIDVLIGRLRRKIEKDPKVPDLIITLTARAIFFQAAALDRWEISWPSCKRAILPRSR